MINYLLLIEEHKVQSSSLDLAACLHLECPWEFNASHFWRTDSDLFMYNLSSKTNFNFLPNPQWVIFAIQSCLHTYYFLLVFLFFLLSLLFEISSHQRLLMVFLWSLSDSKSLQVSRTLLSILADINNSVVWMLSTLPLMYKSSSPGTNLLVTVPSTPITTGITFIFHIFPFSSKV